MTLRFKAYSLTNRDSDEVLHTGRFRGCKVNDPIPIFGSSIKESEINLNSVYKKLVKFAQEIVYVKRGSFEIKVDALIGKTIIEKYGFKVNDESKTNRSKW